MYLIKKNRWSVKQALRHLKLRHKPASPNGNFRRQLGQLAEAVGAPQ